MVVPWGRFFAISVSKTLDKTTEFYQDKATDACTMFRYKISLFTTYPGERRSLPIGNLFRFLVTFSLKTVDEPFRFCMNVGMNVSYVFM